MRTQVKTGKYSDIHSFDFMDLDVFGKTTACCKNISQVQPALQILFLLLGAPLLLQGVPLPEKLGVPLPKNGRQNPSTSSHQIFRSPLKIQRPDKYLQELTTPPSITGTPFHSDKTKGGAEYSSSTGTTTNAGRINEKSFATINDNNLLPCVPLSSQKQDTRKGGEPFR